MGNSWNDCGHTYAILQDIQVWASQYRTEARQCSEWTWEEDYVRKLTEHQELDRNKKEEAWAKVSVDVGLSDQSLSDSEGTAPAASPAAASPAASASGARTRKRKRGKEMDVGEKERESLIEGLVIRSL
ncbi:uncharacterized protein LOC115596498 isoform X2 [Scomber scombrus]|uniref:Uncharacterized protein LOC115596498 isoform X2 n=1 Tax=Scomber scombrus TaxID=13677 RepID=A0AAV1PX26_SCOSC